MINKILTLKYIRILLISGKRIHIVPEKGKWKDGEGSTYAVKNKAVNKARVSSRVTQGAV